MRRPSTAASLLLLALLAIGVAEATLFALLFVFSLILNLRLGIEVGPAAVLLGPQVCCQPQLTLFNAATAASVLFTATCGAGAAAWKFWRWRPVG